MLHVQLCILDFMWMHDKQLCCCWWVCVSEYAIYWSSSSCV